MKHSLVAIFIFGALCWAPGVAEAQSFAPSAARGVELLAKLNLRLEQKRKSSQLLAEARKRAIRLRADIEIAAIDLRSEMEKENPSEAEAGKLILKMSKLEGEWRHSRIVTWLKVRKILSPKQRRELKRLRNVSGRNIVKTQGEFINPFAVYDSARERDRKAEDLHDPFRKRTRKSAAPVERSARGRVQFSAQSPARIIINGTFRGVSPLDIRLKVGKHRVRAVFLDGKPTLKRTISVVANKQSYIHFQNSSQAPGAK